MTKPGDSFVGVLDFFAILLAGAIVTAILAPRVGRFVLGPLIDAPQSDAARWGAFLACAYFLGHLTLLIGSYIDPLYNKLREWRSPYGNTTQAYLHVITMYRTGLLKAAEAPTEP